MRKVLACLLLLGIYLFSPSHYVLAMDDATKNLLDQVKFSNPRKVNINSQEFSIKSLYDLVKARRKLFFDVRTYLKDFEDYLHYNEEQLDNITYYVLSNAKISNWWWVIKSGGLYAFRSTINDLYINQGKRALTVFKLWVDFESPTGKVKDAVELLNYFDLALDFLDTQNISSILQGEGYKFLEGIKIFVENALSGQPISMEMVNNYFKSTATLLKHLKAEQQASLSEFLAALSELYCDLDFIRTYYDASFKFESGEFLTYREFQYIQKLVELKKMKLFFDALDVLAGVLSLKGNSTIVDAIKAIKSTAEMVPFKVESGLVWGLDNEIRNLNGNFQNDLDSFVARFDSTKISEIVKKSLEGSEVPLSYAITLREFLENEELDSGDEIKKAIRALDLDKKEISYLFLARNKSFEKQPVLKLVSLPCIVYDEEPFKDCVISPYGLHTPKEIIGNFIIGNIPCSNAKGSYYITIWGKNGNLVSNEPLIVRQVLDFCYLELGENTLNKIKFSTRNAFKKNGLYFYKFFIQQKDSESGETRNVYIYDENGFISDKPDEDFLQFKISGFWHKKLEWWVNGNYGYIPFVINNELLKWKNYLYRKMQYYDDIEVYYLLGRELVRDSNFRTLFDRVTNDDLLKFDKILKLDCLRTLHKPVCWQTRGFLIPLKAYYVAVRLKKVITNLQKLKQLEIRGLRRYELKHALYEYINQLVQAYGKEDELTKGLTKEKFCKLFSQRNPGKPCKSWFYESFILHRSHIIECPDLDKKHLICRSDFKIAKKINLIKYIGKVMNYHRTLSEE